MVCRWYRLMLATSLGKLEAVRELRQLGASYEPRDNGGSTSLHWACISRNPQLVDWMIEDGADVSVTNNVGRTPLMQLGIKYRLPSDAKTVEGGNSTVFSMKHPRIGTEIKCKNNSQVKFNKLLHDNTV